MKTPTDNLVIFKNSKFELWVPSPGTLGILCMDHKVATKLNRYLEYYDSRIVPGDEPIFFITTTKCTELASLLAPPRGRQGLTDLLSKYLKN